MRRTQKMDAIGQLTGGIAHDFNNILGIILGNISLLNPLVTNNVKVRKRVEAIEKSAQRAADLTKQLLGFSRQQSSQVVTTDINHLIEDMKNLVSRSVTPEVMIEHHFTPDLWLTELDPGDFEDALMNLLINARDAMEGGGRIVIETNNVTLDDAFCNQTSDLAAGDYIQLAVTDSGSGISSDDQDRIFEPFFSTKPRGKGTGLGLAMVFGFVKRSHGHINVYSEHGIGTTFRLYLPRSESTDTPEARKSQNQKNELPWGKETILVVDDEMELLELAKELLSTLGYTVLSATSGKEALEQLSENSDISLLFTDIVMPGGMSGYELAELARVSHPKLKILLTSGYTDKSLPQDGTERFQGQLISKPYTQTELAQRIRTVLGDLEKTDKTNSTQAVETKPKELIFVEWSDTLDLGIDCMDEDDKILISQIKKCQMAIVEEHEDLDETIADLNKFVKKHFEREEYVMESCGYPGLANHRQVHRLLLKQLAEKVQQLKSNAIPKESLQKFLAGWLVDHINTMDRAYVPYCEGADKLIKRGLLDASDE